MATLLQQKPADSKWLPFSRGSANFSSKPDSYLKMAGELSTISKPQLRGLLQSQIKKNLVIAIGLSIVGGVAFQFGVCNPRKQRYADFYKNYDAEKEFQRMKAAGLFQSG